MLTIDSPYLGKRYADKKNKFTIPPHLQLGNFAGQRYAGPTNIAVEKKADVKGTVASNNVKPNVLEPALCWEDIKWLKSITKMQVWVKGVLSSENAEEAVNAGVDGILVSNHGGRQLDGCLATIEALPAIVKVVRGRIPVHVDGGVRKGTDVF